MTVCVATICDDSDIVIGASDRMLTAGDVQFQPPSSKCFTLTRSTVLMTAGDMLVQAELVSQMQERVAALLAEEDPKPDWLKVHGMAGLYVGLDADIKSKRAEIDILRPLGLSLSTFILRQHELSTQLVGQISSVRFN